MSAKISAKRRIYAGRFLKALRETHGLRQGELAARLDISPPYLSQLESDSRALTPLLAARLRDLYPVDWADLAEAPLEPLVTGLMEAARDPQLREALPPEQIERIAEQYPSFAEQFARLYRQSRTATQRLEAIDEALGADTLSGGRLPWEEVREWFNKGDNYVHLIDSGAEAMAGALAQHLPTPTTTQMMAWFAQRGITLRIEAGVPLRQYNADRRELLLDSAQPMESLRFQLAFQLCSLTLVEEITQTVVHSGLATQTARRLLELGLTNYAAGALVMPYRPFRDAARRLRHDVDRLRQTFGTSFEQTCHRLSTLQRPHARGVPVFFCKIDMGGNITKRHAANGLQFARFAGSCPLWIAHEAAAVPDRIHLQVAEMSEGGRYVFLARGQVKEAASYFRPPRRHALVLGWELGLAGNFVYADTLNLDCEEAVARIGISCRICSRLDCHQRAYPPNEKQIAVSTSQRGFVPYQIVE